MHIIVKHKNFDIEEYKHLIEESIRRESLPLEAKIIKLRALVIRAYEAGIADEKAKHDYYQDFNEQ